MCFFPPPIYEIALLVNQIPWLSRDTPPPAVTPHQRNVLMYASLGMPTRSFVLLSFIFTFYVIRGVIWRDVSPDGRFADFAVQYNFQRTLPQVRWNLSNIFPLPLEHDVTSRYLSLGNIYQYHIYG
jgi:hypothetical protein